MITATTRTKPARLATGRGSERGALPKPPKIKSSTNRSYQTHLDTLRDLAAAGDWKGVRRYEVNGVNTYAKMVARYRDALLEAHRAEARK